MKNIALVLIAILVFSGCLIFGFQLADQVYTIQANDQPAALGEDDRQQNWLIIKVDRFDSNSPRLTLVWFVSLFFENEKPILTFAQVYPGKEDSNEARALEKTFNFNAQHEPVPEFWKAYKSYDLPVSNYAILDQIAFEQFVEWANRHGTGKVSFDPVNGQPELKPTMEIICPLLSGLNEPAQAFHWKNLVPDHFHSNLRLETTLSALNKINLATEIACEFPPPLK